MTITLLRRIWKQIIADIPSLPAKQRLTGFEPLEPRMVLSGFVAFLTPDYFSPPPGDFSHIERSGAEIARPMAEFGEYGEYKSMGRGVAEASSDLGSISFQPVGALFDHPAMEE